MTFTLPTEGTPQRVPETISITSSVTGVRFIARILRTGDGYGLDNVLTWDDERPGVEFYDARYDHTPLGQFTSRYYVETILEGPGPSGLDLHGGVDSWKIDGQSMQIVRAWLHHETS